MTRDIESIQDFVTSALLGIVTNALTLVGIIGVMLYLNWRFTLISLAVAPVLFLVVSRNWPTYTSSSPRCPTGTTRWSASAG